MFVPMVLFGRTLALSISAMNVKRFQFILSQEDPLVVSEGLDTFRQQILREHDALLSFGCNGRSVYIDTEKALYPSRIPDIKGLLLAFIQSSPFGEEIFVLWRLIVDRNELRDLCASLMQCISAILYCSSINQTYCTNIVTKILSEFNKYLQLQLSSGNIKLIHSTLGLLISIARSSGQNCKDVYQRVLFSTSNDNIYVTMLQKGKIVKWITKENIVDISSLNYNNDNIHEVIVSDSRSFLVILILTILKNADTTMYSELMNTNSLFKRILNSIHKDEQNLLKIIFDGLLTLMNIDKQYIVSIDNNCINNLFVLYKSENEQIQEIVDDFMQKYSIFLINSVSDNNSYYHNRGYYEKTILYIIKELQGHVDLRHRKLQLLFLKKRPNLLVKCINSLTTSWDPVISPSYDYICALSHLTYLLCNVDIDNNYKMVLRQLKENINNDKADSNMYKSSIEEMFTTFLPANLFKKDLTKLLQSPNKVLQKMGINVMIALTKRLTQVIYELSPTSIKNNLFLTYFNMAINKHFPDFQIISNLFLKFEKNICEGLPISDTSQKHDMEVENGDMSSPDENQDDFDFALPSTKNEVDDSVANEDMMLLLLHLFHNYVNLVPSLVAQSSFDILRLLDYVNWLIEQSTDDDRSMNTIHITLSIISLSCNKGLCQWFGTHSDTIKMVTALLTNSDDWINIKQSSLLKLFLLYSNERDNKILNNCDVLLMDIVNNVLKQSSIFWIEGKLEYENSIELYIWKKFLKKGSLDTLQLISIILRIHKHWHINYCVEVDKMQQVITVDISMSEYLKQIEILDIEVESNNSHHSSQTLKHSVIFSSLIYCAISLCCCNFNALLSHLPNHIRTDIIGSKSSISNSMFLNKFNNSALCNSMRDLISDAIMRITFHARNQMWCINALVCSIEYLDNGNESNFSKWITTSGQLFQNDGAIIEANSDTEQNYVQNILGKLMFRESKKKRIKLSTTDDSEIIGLDVMIRWSPYLMYSLLQNINNICEVDSTKNKMNMFTIKDTWILLTKLHLQQLVASEFSSINVFFSWILNNISYVISNDENACLEFINEGKVIHFIDIIYHISQIVQKISRLSSEDLIKTNKRKTSDSSELLLQAREICSSLVRIIVDFVQRNGFTNSILIKSLTTSLFRLGICDKCEYFGSSIRQIIKILAISLIDNSIKVSYERRSVRGNRDSLYMFWNFVARELCNYSFDTNNFNADSKDASYKSELFSLGWLVQQVIPIPMLRKKYVNIALHNVDGYKLMDLNKNALVSSAFNSAAIVSNEIPISILNCVSQSRLSRSMIDYISNIFDADNFHDLNSLTGISIGIGRNNLSNHLKFYCDPILLIDSSLVLHFKELKNKCVKSTNINLISQYLFSLSNRSSVVKLLLSASEWKFTRSNGDVLSEICAKFSDIKSLDCIIAMLRHAMFIKSRATTQICNNYINTAVKDQSLHIKTEFIYESLVNCLNDILLYAVSNSTINDSYEEGVALWNKALMEVFSYFVDSIASLIIDPEHSSKSEFITYSSYIFSLITFTIPEKICSKIGMKKKPLFQFMIQSMQQLHDRLRKRVNKWIKLCLKHSFDALFTLNLLSQFNVKLCGTNSEVDVSNKLLLWNNTFKFNHDDFYNPIIMLQLILGHSKFLQVLNGADTTPHIPLLQLILVLISAIINEDSTSNDSKDSSSDNNYSFVMNVLLGIYTGTMSEKDRIIYRTLTLLSNDNKIPALCKLKPPVFVQKTSNSVNWILGAMSLPTIYTTLMHFPCWRSILPQPFDIESYKSRNRYLKELKETMSTLTKDWSLMANISNSKGSTKDDFVMDIVGDDHDDDDEDSVDDEDIVLSSDNGIDEDINYIDEENNSSAQNSSTIDCIQIIDPSTDNSSLNGVYDPAFWLPSLHYLLQLQEISIRQLSNCGLLSLVFVSLGSNCPISRSYALSCLSTILLLLKKQTPEKDPAFRERLQLLLLVNFVRNGFDPKIETNDTKCPKLPMSTALFAARAALHLMQPSHELYSKINKYLLSRPYCDVKDIPLYDFSVMSGNNESIGDISIQLSTLRLVRDGLSSKEDHLNLCRKNAYSRLMMMFRIVSNVDIKCGHAILDLFEKALTIKDSARYLIERCGIILWLQQNSSPKCCIVESDVMKTDPRIYNEESKVKTLINEIPLKLLSRSLVILRRAIAADFVLSCEGIKSNTLSFFRCLCSIIDEVIIMDEIKLSHYIPVDFIKQLIIAIWDSSLTSSADDHLEWNINRLFCLAKAIPNIIVGVDDETQDIRSDLIISILSLISFKSRLHEYPISIATRDQTRENFPSLLNMMMNSLTNLLFTGKNLYDKTCNYICVFPQEILENHLKIASSSKAYSCILHLFHGDFKRFNVVDLQQNIRNTWNVLANFDMNNTILPCEGNLTVGMCSVMSKSIINCLVYYIEGMNDDKFLAVDTSNSLFRWILSIKLILLNERSNNIPNINKDINLDVKKRLYSIIDGGVDLSHYNNGFQNFQLLYRLTIIGVITLLLNLPPWFKSEQSISIINSFSHAIHTLLGCSYDNEDTSNRLVLLKLLKSINNDFDGMVLWSCIMSHQYHDNHDILSINDSDYRNLCYNLCYLCLDIIGTIISINDRIISSESNNLEDIFSIDQENEMIDNIYIIYHGPSILSDICNKIVSSNIHLQMVTSKDNQVIDNYDIFESSAHNSNKNIRMNSNWKNIPKQSRESIISGMKSGRTVPLAGNVSVTDNSLE